MVETIFIKGLQNFDKYNTLNPVEIKIFFESLIIFLEPTIKLITGIFDLPK